MRAVEQSKLGRPKWVQVQQNSLSYILQQIDYIPFTTKVTKSWNSNHFSYEHSIPLTQFVHFFCIVSDNYGF